MMLLLARATGIAMAAGADDLRTAADLANFAQPLADARIHYGDDPLQFVDLRLPPGSGPHPVAITYD